MKLPTQSMVGQSRQDSGELTSHLMGHAHQDIRHYMKDLMGFVLMLASLSAFTIVTIVLVIKTVISR